MPTKQKNQHLVPQCYLVNFISSEIPAEHQENVHFERGIWTTSPTLDDEWRLQGIRNLLRRSYAYSLPEDSPHHQKIERFLSTVETPWPGIIQTLISERIPSPDQESELRMFVSTLYQRTDSTMDMVQGWIGDIERLYRDVERASTGQDRAADEVFSEAHNTPKKLIEDTVFYRVFRSHRLHFLRNMTTSPFLSSDSPVSLTHRHADEVACLLPSPSLIESSATANLRRPLVLCPMTPKLMLLVCEFVSDQYPGFPFITLTDQTQAIVLNVLTIENAQDVVLSSVRFPFDKDQPGIAALLRTGSCGPRQHGAWMLLYTNRNRYWLPLDDWKHTLQAIVFRTPDLDQLRRASEDESLESAEIFVDGRNRAGMRDIRFEDVDLSGMRSNRIGSQCKLSIGK